MPTRVEIPSIDYPGQWVVTQVIAPDHVGVYKQHVSSREKGSDRIIDREKRYLVFCSEDDSTSTIYQNRVPTDEFDRKVEQGGLDRSADIFEVATLSKGKAHEIALKNDENNPRVLVRFHHV